MSPGTGTLLRSSRNVTWADLCATTLLGFESALIATTFELDLFGVLVVAGVGALGGGALRDMILGQVPAAIRDQRYLMLAFLGGVAGFLLPNFVDVVIRTPYVALDAVGLSLFAITGTVKAIDHPLPAIPCVLMGALTAVGGGVMRDLLVDRIPIVLYVDVYATAALLGSAVVVVGIRRGLARAPAIAAGALTCFVLRMLSWQFDWNLPTAFGG